MPDNLQQHHRRSLRLRDYDYSQEGAYFITICAQGKLCLFGEPCESGIKLWAAGRMIEDWWLKLPTKFLTIEPDEFVVMPNHFHGVLTIVGATPCGCQPKPDHTTESGHPRGGAPTVGDAIDWFKTMTTNAYIRGVSEQAWPRFSGRLWQRNYYEHVIRNEDELNRARQYIIDNPVMWARDPAHS